MPRQYWVQTLPPFAIADGTALTASATLTDFMPAPQCQVAAGLLGDFGGVGFEFEASGLYTTTGTQGTITFGVYSGTIGQAIGSAAALAVSSAVTWVASQTNRVWGIRGHGRLRTPGTGGTCYAFAEASNLSSGTTDMAATAAGATVTVDTSVTRYLTIAATLSAASQSITCRDVRWRLSN